MTAKKDQRIGTGLARLATRAAVLNQIIESRRPHVAAGAGEITMNASRAARLLGVSRQLVWKRLTDLGVDAPGGARIGPRLMKDLASPPDLAGAVVVVVGGSPNVGATTVAIHLLHFLAIRGAATMALDLAPGGNLESLIPGVAESVNDGLFRLKRSVQFPEVLQIASMDWPVGSSDIRVREMAAARTAVQREADDADDTGIEEAIGREIRDVASRRGCVLVIDAPPSSAALTKIALRAADLVVVCVQSDCDTGRSLAAVVKIALSSDCSTGPQVGRRDAVVVGIGPENGRSILGEHLVSQWCPFVVPRVPEVAACMDSVGSLYEAGKPCHSRKDYWAAMDAFDGIGRLVTSKLAGEEI